jgi:hypothetical protein
MVAEALARARIGWLKPNMAAASRKVAAAMVRQAVGIIAALVRA